MDNRIDVVQATETKDTVFQAIGNELCQLLEMEHDIKPLACSESHSAIAYQIGENVDFDGASPLE